MGDDLLGKFEITVAAPRARVVEKNGLAVAGGFGQADVARDDGREDAVAEEVAQVGHHLAGKAGALVVHGGQDTFHGEFRVEGMADSHQGVQ